MVKRADWATLRDRRMREPDAQESYAATALAYELGRAVRQLREQHGWSQSELGHRCDMTQSAVARFEAGGTMPTLPVLSRLADALDADLVVNVKPRA
ncbi:MAG TPA: helix-turn-helix transcriptional regulator [Jiangellaceae bacterium]